MTQKKLNKNEQIKPKADFLFEVSWEVGNKVGGIWTVLKSKARPTIEHYGQDYCLIGPYFSQAAKGEFEEDKIPQEWQEAFLTLEKEGLKLKFGFWLAPGNPKAILVDFSAWLNRGDQIKKDLWDNFKIDSLNAPLDYTEPLVWAFSAGLIIEKLGQTMPGKKIVAQFHEWLSGAGLLYLKMNGLSIGTVFTTHATVLGRAMSSANVPVESLFGKINANDEAYKYGVASKHQLERACAQKADVFTTVSQITALESETILGRFADVLLPNGLDMSRFPTIEEISIKHKAQRDKIRNFLFWYFFPYYGFDLKETLFYFTIGRYEFKNKGIDVFIKSLGQLNKKLKQEKSKKTVVAFFWIPSQIASIKRELVESREIYNDIKDQLESIEDDLEGNLLRTLVLGERIEKGELFKNKEEALWEIKNKILKFKKQGNPPLFTHNLDSSQDDILQAFQNEGLLNDQNDRVKVIYYPIYLNGADGILNLTADEAIQGSHLGVFPSQYEPWGYTALEAAACGVGSITTDMAGFGRFCLEHIKGKKLPGVFVLERLNKTEKEITDCLFKILYNFSKISVQQRVDNKIQARKLANLADWETLIQNYIVAHNKAIK